MEYRFVKVQENYEDYANGKVLYSHPGTTSFPVRLASEIFQRCREMLDRKGVKAPYTIYDPCCGGAYMLTVTGFLHPGEIGRFLASDVDQAMVDLAGRNLGLLTAQGMAGRIEQLQDLIGRFDKASHREALESAFRLRDRAGTETGMETEMLSVSGSPSIRCFQADILAGAPQELLQSGEKVDLVMTDVPYGSMVHWSEEAGNPAERLLDSIHPLLGEGSVVALIMDKKQKVAPERYVKNGTFKLGKRQILFLHPQ